MSQKEAKEQQDFNPVVLQHELTKENIDLDTAADHLIYAVNTYGLDTRNVVINILGQAKNGREYQQIKEEEEKGPLSPEYFITSDDTSGYCAVTIGDKETYLPQNVKAMELKRGDKVMVDPHMGRIMAKDTMNVPTCGVVTNIERIPVEFPGSVIIKEKDTEILVRLPESLKDEPLEVGTRVIYDPNKRFVLGKLNTKINNNEILTPVESLSEISRKDLGAPNPILDKILFRMRMWVDYPNWMEKLKVRPKMSYLFIGATGTGKTMLLKVLARELTDYVEELTGTRVSRLVMVDASSFYSPWFGSTEQNIISFFSKLSAVGNTKLKNKKGEELRLPLLVVLEEAESLFRGRGEEGGSSHLFDRPLSLILQKLDSITNELNIPLLFCSTTNRPDLIDPAARRRMGINSVHFGMLNYGQAANVIDKKVDRDMPIKGEKKSAHSDFINKIVGYLYTDEENQGLVEVKLSNNQTKVLQRREMVTPAIIEMAISSAIDDCIIESSEENKLIGIDADNVIKALDDQYTNMSKSIRASNVREYWPGLFEDHVQVSSVRPLLKRALQEA